ncbi:MAG: YfiR family protein [Pseudoxanthomonas sp.]
MQSVRDPRRGTPRALVALAGLLLAIAPGAIMAIAPSLAQATPTSSESGAQAAYLVSLLHFTQWPDESFEGADSPYVIAVIGDRAIADQVRAVATATGRLGRRAVEVRWIAAGRGTLAAPFDSAQDRENLLQIKRSHLVFFHSSAGAVPSQALSDLWGQPVLTVSDVPDFIQAGGMIGLVVKSGRVGLEANPMAIRNARLTLSAKVLKLARAKPSVPR